MNVIALCGSSNTGKTNTLRLLIKSLIKAGSTVIDPENMKDLDKYSDIRCCLKTKSDKKVCITTPGDNKIKQDDNLLYVSKIQDVD